MELAGFTCALEKEIDTGNVWTDIER